MSLYPDVVFKVNFEDDPLAPYDEYIQALGPLGYWRLNESAGTNADDSSPNNRDGTYTGGFTLSQTGALVPYGDSDNAVSFNGTTGYVEFASSSIWRNLNTRWTICCWIYPTATREADSIDVAGIIDVGSAALNNTPFFLRYGRFDTVSSLGSNVWAGWHNTGAGGWNTVVDTIGEPPLNTWTNYLATYDGTVIVLYRNFEPVARNNAAAGATAAESDVPLRLGRDAQNAAGSGTNAFFPGRLDEAFILDWAMAPADVAKLEGSLSSPADKSANFIDLSTRVRAFSFRSGRQDNVNRVEASDATVLLDNRDGALLPDPVVNLLPNPSFEEDQPYIPFRVEGGTKAQDTTHVHLGTYAAKFTGSAATAYLTSAQGGLTAMRPGKTYTFSAYVYVPSATGVDLADVSLQIVDEVAAATETASSGNPGSFNTFVRLTVTKTIRSNADASYCRVAFVVDVPGDSIWVDAVQLEQASAVTTYADGTQTDCRWNGEPHLSLTHRKVSGSYRNIMPGRLARLQVVWNGTTSGLLKGFIDDYAYSYPGKGADAVVTLRLTDGFRTLSQQSMKGLGRPAESAGARVRAILRSAGVPESDIAVDDDFIDTSTLAALTVTSDTSARALIAEVEETEKGLFFIDGDGLHTYQGSLYRSVGAVEAFRLKDDFTGIPYTELAARLDLQNVRNVASITNEASGNLHAFIQPASVRRFFPITGTETSKWALDIASYVDRSTPHPFADAIAIAPASNPTTLWPLILGLGIGDLGKIERVRGGRDLFQGYLQFLEGIEHAAVPGGPWDVRLRTTPVLQSPIPISSWNSPIAVPALLTGDRLSASQASYTTASSTYTNGRLYVLFVSSHRTATPSPATPTFTSTYSWTQIRTDAVTFGSRFGRWCSFYTVAGSTTTEALIINFATNNPAFCQWVIFEIASGFDATPIGSSNFTDTSASTMQADVGTLLDSQSIVLANAYKDSASSPIWPVFTAVYTNGLSPATTAAFGNPGLDTGVIQWGVGEAGYCETVEIDAA